MVRGRPISSYAMVFAVTIRCRRCPLPGISPRLQLCGEQETRPRTGATWFRRLYV